MSYRICKTSFLLAFFCVGFSICSFAEASGTAREGGLSESGTLSGTSSDKTEFQILPMAGFLSGWSMEGKAESFSRETLYQHIDGEAEMYLPYGFELLTSAYYLGAEGKKSLEVDIFRMGSLLDAFGIYSNYRDPDGEALKEGADGVISENQLMFYQDRYFVQLSAPSAKRPDRKTFIAFAEAISRKLPAPSASPKELNLLKAPDVSPRTEKYVAESLLGYKFFHKGLTAEATFEGKPVKLFVVLTGSETEASTTLGLYCEYLKKEGRTPQRNEASGKTLITQDPLYKGVVMRQSGPYLLGISKLEDTSKGIALLDRWASLLSF